MTLFGIIWHHLDPFGPDWPHLTLLGHSSILISRYVKVPICQGVQRQLVQSLNDFYIDKVHSALDIFQYALILLLLFKQKFSVPSDFVLHQRSSSFKWRLPLEVFHQSMSSIIVCIPLKVALHQWLSSIEGFLSSKVVFYQRLSSIEGCLPLKVVFYQKLLSIEGCFPWRVTFHRRSSYIECPLP